MRGEANTPKEAIEWEIAGCETSLLYLVEREAEIMKDMVYVIKSRAECIERLRLFREGLAKLTP